MLRIHAIILFCIVSFNSFSLGGETFVNQFGDNRNGWGWETVDNTYKQSQVLNNTYQIACKQEEGAAYFLNYLLIDYSKDFEFNTELHVDEGDNIAVVWGSDAHNYNYHKIELFEHSFFIQTWFNGKVNFLVKDATSEGIYDLKNRVSIKIKQVNGETSIFINGKLVNEGAKLDAYGLASGYSIHGLGKTMVLNYSFKYEFYDESKINAIHIDEKVSKKESLGNHINSIYDEINPIISPDGKILFFTQSKIENEGHMSDNIFYSELNQNGDWSQAKSIGRNINNEAPNDIVSALPDGNEIIIKGNYGDEKNSSAGLGMSFKTEGGWSSPKGIKIVDYGTKADHVSNCINSTGKVLISSLERKGGKGELDLYVSFLLPDGSYSTPKNMGLINTSGNEETPFIASDDKTLYFSSDAWPGYGSHDIFMVKRLNDDWTQWSQPKNLGPKINTPDWDAYYSVPASGQYGYLVSYSNSLGGSDIFKMELPEEAKPEPVVLISGQVLHKDTKKPIEARIIYYDLNTNEEIGVAHSSSQDGSYSIILPSGKNYSFMAEMEDYYAIGQHFNVKSLSQFTKVEMDLVLAPIEVGQKIELNNIFFDEAKSELIQTSFYELNSLVTLLNKHPKFGLTIQGHTDNVGSQESNQLLSQKRAEAVMKYLLQKGVSKDRLTSVGLGETQPKVENNSPENKAKNRRVEFVIVTY
jgi:outer membrane protein OmpA-like peptidoglycan-associated protein